MRTFTIPNDIDCDALTVGDYINGNRIFSIRYVVGRNIVIHTHSDSTGMTYVYEKKL